MKKSMLILILAIIFVFLLLLSLIVYNFILPIFILGNSENQNEDFLFTSVSPDRNITLEVYRDNGNATVDYSIRVYKKLGDRKKLVYNKYHQKEVEIKWISNDIVSISGVKLDFSKNQTYDWRKDGFRTVDTGLAMWMGLSVKYKGKSIIENYPEEYQWWITGFNPKYLNTDPKDLSVTIGISMPRAMYEDFKKEQYNDPYVMITFCDPYGYVSFTF